MGPETLAPGTSTLRTGRARVPGPSQGPESASWREGRGVSCRIRSRSYPVRRATSAWVSAPTVARMTPYRCSRALAKDVWAASRSRAAAVRAARASSGSTAVSLAGLLRQVQLACQTDLAYDQSMSLPLAYGAVDPIGTSVQQSRVGSISELRASAHLMQQGFDVFRCVAPHAPFDLVAYRDGQLYRVEVKTASKPSRETYSPVVTWPVNDEWDLLVVCGDRAIFQFPFGVTRDQVRDELRRAYRITAAAPVMPPPPARPSVEKRVMQVFGESPTSWSCQAMRHELESRGWTTQALDKTAIVSDAMRRLSKRGLLLKVEPGRYRLHAGMLAVGDDERSAV